MCLTSQIVLADWSFSTIPFDGKISGQPGATIGWGYSITNDDPLNWLVVSGISAGSFQFGTPDSSIFDYPILAPLTSVNVNYDGTAGLYQLTWDSLAPAGLVNIGTFTLNAELYSSNPYEEGIYIENAGDKLASYEAKVDAAPVPEPSTILLLATGLASTVFICRRKKSMVSG